ncbi:MAG: tetratricopeptide repeat protein, partial [Anaerolineae bacterium]|nr:tetratricopeptide repeat protein [Anaerolineae bacterium]
EIKRDLGDQAGIAKSLHQLGIIAQDQGEHQQAKELYNQSLEIERTLGDQAGIAASLFQLGRVAEDEGKSDEAIRLFKESLAIAEKLDVPEAEMVRQALARVSKEKE